MKRLMAMVLLAAFVMPLMGANCNTVVRDETVYKTELDFMEQTAKQPADKLVEWINLSCKCENGVWVEANAVLCDKSAKLVQVIRSRVPWHKEMMLYNASLTEKRPPAKPPAVPPTTDLCPGS
jgi:hypothetical protein